MADYNSASYRGGQRQVFSDRINIREVPIAPSVVHGRDDGGYNGDHDDRAYAEQSHAHQDYGQLAYEQPIFAPSPRRAPNYTHPSHVTGHDYREAAATRYGQRPDPQGGPELAFRVAPDRVTQIVHWAGTLCSVLFLLGGAYWGYELAVRDVNGIPVVRAAAGPLRIAPVTPGGDISANQGLAVNAIAATGGMADLPEEVTLAPAPVALTPEDVAPETPGDLLALTASLPEDMPISDEAAVEAALAMALSEGNDAPVEVASLQPAADPATDPAPEPATKSNTDTAQPAALAPLDAAPIDATMSDPTEQQKGPPNAEVDPTQIPVGTKMVQLGAFDDDATARAEWANLQTRFADLIGPKALVVQQAKSGGRVFYRLRAHGFTDEDETRRFCAALLAENASCIPVAQR